MPKKIALEKLGVGAIAGLADIGLEKIDESFPIEAPIARPIQTVGRAALFLVGLAGSYMVKEGSKWVEPLETLMVAETPLVIRSIAKGIGFIADYSGAPSREAIELRLRGGQVIPPTRPEEVAIEL